MNRTVIIFLVIHVALCLLLSFFALPLLKERFNVSVYQDEYHILGQNLAAGKGFTGDSGDESVIRGPGYPVFLALIFSLFGSSIPAVQIAQALLSALNILLIYLLVRNLHSHRTALIALILSALNPFLVWYTARLMVETLFMTTMLLIFISTWALINKPSLRNTILSGIAFAMAAFIKSLVMILPVVIPIVMLLTGKRLNKAAVTFAAVVVTMIMVILPWTIRNYVVTDGKFIPVHASLALPLTQSYLYCEYFGEEPFSAQKAFDNTNEKLKEITTYAGYEPFHYPLHSLDSELRMEKAAKKYFGDLYGSDPMLFVSHAFIRSLLFWYYSTNVYFSIFWMILNGLLLLLFIPGLFSGGPVQSRFVVIWVLVFWGIHALIIASSRFTLPLQPLMLSIAIPFLLYRFPILKRIPILRQEPHRNNF